MSLPLEIQKRKKGDVVVLDLVGNLTLGEPEQAFRDLVTDLISRKQTRILVNLEAIDFMDSSGIGALVKTYTTVLRLGGSLKLLKPAKRIRQTLHLTGLLGVLQVWEDEMEALASF